MQRVKRVRPYLRQWADYQVRVWIDVTLLLSLRETAAAVQRPKAACELNGKDEEGTTLLDIACIPMVYNGDKNNTFTYTRRKYNEEERRNDRESNDTRSCIDFN